MTNISTIKKTELAIFIAGTIIAVLSLLLKELEVFTLLVLIFCLFYLGGGWYFLKGANKDDHTALLFFTGYFFASAYLSVIFASMAFPLKEYLAGFTLAGLVVFLILFIVRNVKPEGPGYVKLITQTVIMILLTGSTFFL
ncbi:MAG: hypothetical protein JSV24_03785 [Bacteroidales bacterium]|nr:MAG: hypothetical protein JSV24_03785 [Bacteroidales bacterium]